MHRQDGRCGADLDEKREMVGAGRFELPTPGPPERDTMFFLALPLLSCLFLSLKIKGE